MNDVRVIRGNELSTDTAQTSGLLRQVALDARSGGDVQLSAFISSVHPEAFTGAHHHGSQDTVLFVLSGHAAYAWGSRLENLATAEAGDFVYIPAGTIHQEINPSTSEVSRWVVVRSGAEPVVVNLDELDELAAIRADEAISAASRDSLREPSSGDDDICDE